MFAIQEKSVEPIRLPGRNWKMLINEKVGCKNITFGLAEFPAGSDPGDHTHEVQEEIIYILEGNGYMRYGSDGQTTVLEPGVAIHVPPGVPHGVVNNGKVTIRLITLFSPQVVPGSYDKKN